MCASSSNPGDRPVQFDLPKSTFPVSPLSRLVSPKPRRLTLSRPDLLQYCSLSRNRFSSRQSSRYSSVFSSEQLRLEVFESLFDHWTFVLKSTAYTAG